jgi:hypothetical protein
MTGPLRNARHERFVQLLLQGENATDAYEGASFKRDDGNATRLAANPKVQARLAELQSQIAGETKITVSQLLNELESARAKATDLDQLSAAVRAIESKARISGLMVQKVEVGGVGEFKGETTQEIAAEFAADYLSYIGSAPFKSITEDDRDALANLIIDASQRIDDFLRMIAARPISRNIQAQTAALLANGRDTRQ